MLPGSSHSTGRRPAGPRLTVGKLYTSLAGRRGRCSEGGKKQALGELARLDAEQQHYDAALESIDEAIALAPKSSQFQLDRGDILAMKGDLRGAEEAYRSAMGLDASNATAMNNLAWLLADRRTNLDEALSAARRAVELQPKNARFADTPGVVYRARGETAEARESLQKALQLGLAEPQAGDARRRLQALTGR